MSSGQKHQQKQLCLKISDQSMELNKERNFVCKFCSKRFPCGKSLGGHIRTHMNENSGDSDEEEANKLILSNNNGSNGQTSYGLRENPKKTKKFVDQSEIALKQQLICRECGKGFNSLKALCGHMACHSEREKVVMDSQSDTETSSAPGRRSKRVMKQRHKGFIGNQSNSHSYAHGNSSSESEIEQEQEELALCLMMLSRDSSFKKVNNNPNSVAESSDNNSVILETKSSSIDVRINLKNLGNCGYNADEILEMKNLRENNQLKSAEKNGALLSDSDTSDSAYFENGPKKADSDVSFDRFLKNSGFNKPSFGFGSRSEDSRAKPVKSLNRFKTLAKFEKELINEGEERASAKYDLRKSKRICSYDPQRKSKYEIKTNEFAESVYESGENSVGADSCAETRPGLNNIRPGTSKNPPNAYKKQSSKKKSKGHECPICFRVFKSGQALGGHKRSHFIGNHENSTVVIQEQSAEMPGLIDLNLPAPVDE